MSNNMFCYQCQETVDCKGCTISGVCGKKPEVANLQDLLIFVTKGLSCVTTSLRKENIEIPESVNHLITVNLFTTITNANFDYDDIQSKIEKTLSIKDELISKLASKDMLPIDALWSGDRKDFDEKAKTVGVLSTENEDIRSLRELITYG